MDGGNRMLRSVSSFLQSKEWEEVQRSLGRETFRAGKALVIAHPLPGGEQYLYCPRPSHDDLQFERDLDCVSLERKSVFVKVDQDVEPYEFGSLNVVRTHSIQPQETILLDLRDPEEEILGRMREKTRYNIRLAERRGVSVSRLLGGFETFFSLLEETAEREQFRLHPRKHYEAILSASTPDFFNAVFIAHWRGEPAAAALVNFYRPSGIATYLHGGSSRTYKESMAPHLLHWEIIREARRLGFAAYDFWGTEKTRWPGIARFKEGFRGMHVRYPDSVDLVYRPGLYLGYQFARSVFRKP